MSGKDGPTGEGVLPPWCQDRCGDCSLLEPDEHALIAEVRGPGYVAPECPGKVDVTRLRAVVVPPFVAIIGVEQQVYCLDDPSAVLPPPGQIGHPGGPQPPNVV